MKDVTKNEAKKMVIEFLKNRNLPFTKVTAKLISFEDLARDEKIFVTVFNTTNGIWWLELQDLAMKNGFKVVSGICKPI